MLINLRAVAGIGRVDGDAGMCLAQHPRQVLLALLDRSRPYVRTIEFKEVEGAQSRRVVMLAIAQQVEDREAALVHDDGLAVDDAAIDG